MGDIVWSKTENFYVVKSTIINNNVNRNDWIGFLDALGWMENNGNYGGITTAGYIGIYQVGRGVLDDIKFFDGLGKELLGVTSRSDLANNPIAQELAGIMEFSGVPDIDGKNFVSKYYAVKSDAQRLYNLSNEKFDQLIGKTFTINYTDVNGQIVGTDTITLTTAGISAAAHLVGQGTMAKAMAEIYSDCFTTDAQGNVTQTSSTATLSTTGFADGNNIAFSAYVKLLQDYDISPLLSASTLTDFNQLTTDLITYRKDKIIDYLITKKQEVTMSVSYGTNDYRETVRSILQGLSLPTDNLNTIDGQVVLAGANNSKFTDKADLIFGVGNVDNILKGDNGNDIIYGQAGNDTIEGGEGNDILIGGEGVDTYVYKAGDGNDQISDTGENQIIIEKANGEFELVRAFYKTGDNIWTTPDGEIEITHHSPWQIVLEDGSTLTLGENLQDGDFGIHLKDVLANNILLVV